MGLVVGLLNRASAVCLIDGLLHGIGDHVRIHDNPAVGISRGSSHSLNQGGLRAEESLLIRIQNRHQGDLRNIQALPQEIDSHQHVEHIQAHVADNLRPLQGIHVGVKVLHPDSRFLQEVGQVLGHPLCQRGHHHLVFLIRLPGDLGEQVIDLALHRPHIDGRIQQSRRADQLLCPQHLMLLLILRRRGGAEQDLVQLALKLVEGEGAVIQGRGQAESVIDQDRLSRPVAVVHAADLGNGHVGLIDDQQEFLGEIVHQGTGRIPRLREVQLPGIVLDAGAESRLPHHLHVKVGPLRNSLGLNQLVLALEIGHLLLHLLQNILRGQHHLLLRHHIVGSREDGHMAEDRPDLSGQGIDLRDPVDLIAEKLDPVGRAAGIGRIDLDGITPHPEASPLEIHIIAVVLDLHQLPDDVIPVLLHAGAEGDDHVFIVNGAAQTVNAGNRSHDDNVASLRQGRRGGVPQLIDLVIDGGILLDIGIRRGHIGLRLVIVIVGDKVFHGIFREELLHLPVQLGRQRLVVGDDQRRFIELFDDIGHGKGLSRTGDAQQGFALVSLFKTLHQLLDGPRLVARGLKLRMQHKMIHGVLPFFRRLPNALTVRLQNAAFHDADGNIVLQHGPEVCPLGRLG